MGSHMRSYTASRLGGESSIVNYYSPIESMNNSDDEHDKVSETRGSHGRTFWKFLVAHEMGDHANVHYTYWWCAQKHCSWYVFCDQLNHTECLNTYHIREISWSIYSFTSWKRYWNSNFVAIGWFFCIHWFHRATICIIHSHFFNLSNMKLWFKSITAQCRIDLHSERSADEWHMMVVHIVAFS